MNCISIGKFKMYKSPDTDHIPAELIKAGGEMLGSEICKLNRSVRNKEVLPQQWKETIIVPIYEKGDKIVIIEDLPLINCLLNFIQHSSGQVNSICH
jgi:hypothetical protein